jgi:hypothetical protein
MRCIRWTAVLAVLVLSACGGDGGGNDKKTLDVTELERSLADSIGGGTSAPSGIGGTSSGPSVEDVKVVCPKDVEQKAGVSFECNVSGVASSSAPQPGEPVTGRVTVTESDASGTKFKTKTRVQGGGVTQTSSGDTTITAR